MTNFQTAQIFGDNMVLQFQKPVSVFGTGTDGTKITIINWKKYIQINRQERILADPGTRY